MEGTSQAKDANPGSQKEDDKFNNEIGRSGSQESQSSSEASTPVQRALRMSILHQIRRKTSHTPEASSGSHDKDNDNGDEGQEITWKRHGQLQAINEDEQQLEFDSDEGDSSDSESSRDSGIPASKRSIAASRASNMIKNIRRRSAFTILKSGRFALSHRHLPSDMDLVRNQLKNTYLSSGDAVLLHGYLHIQIIRAKGLRNMDCLRGCQTTMFCPFINDLSDPYVTVHAGAHRLLKTPSITNNLNPEWNLDFFVPVCHPITHLEFRVKDRDTISSDTLGKCSLPVHELIRFSAGDDDEDGVEESSFNLSASGRPDENSDWTERSAQIKMLRTGVHKVVHLDNKPQHGSLEYFAEFIPKDLLHSPPKNRGLLTKKSTYSMVVPGVYFPLRQGNRVRFYVDANDNGEAMGTPPVRYGAKGLETTWKPRRFFRDVYDSICEAKQMAYIVGWSVDHTISLLRGKEQNEGLNKRESGGTYSPKIGELLNQKADEGVVVNMLVWDDMTSNSLVDGVVATRDEQLRNYFFGSKVNLRLVPMVGGDANMLKRFRLSVYYTHHQKCIIVDNPKKELVAYVGKSCWMCMNILELRNH